MDLSPKEKIYRRKGKSVRVPKAVRIGTKRKTENRPLQCKKCGKFFSSLGEINRHYTSRSDHTRATPKPKKVPIKEFREFSKEQQQQAIVVANLLFDKNEFRRRMREIIQRRFGNGRYR